MKSVFKKIIKPAAILFIICFVVTVLLALTAEFTDRVIEEKAKRELNETRKSVLSGAVSFEAVDGYENAVYGVDESNNPAGYVFTITVDGYGGEMQAIVGIGDDGKVDGVNILSHSETPGLGSKATEKDFLIQFEGLFEKAKAGQGVDMITGATVSSEAVIRAVNIAIEEYISIAGGENE